MCLCEFLLRLLGPYGSPPTSVKIIRTEPVEIVSSSTLHNFFDAVTTWYSRYKSVYQQLINFQHTD